MKVQSPKGQLIDFPDDAKDSEILEFFNQEEPLPMPELPPEYRRVNMAGIGPFGPPVPEEVLNAPLLRLGRGTIAATAGVTQDIGAAATEMARAFMESYGMTPPERGAGLIQVGSYPVTAGPLGQVLRQYAPEVAEKIDIAGGELLSSLTEPGLMLTAGLGGTKVGMAAAAPIARTLGATTIPEQIAAKALPGYFATSIAAGLPSEVEMLAQAPSIPEFAGQAFKTSANLGMGLLLGRSLAKRGPLAEMEAQRAAQERLIQEGRIPKHPRTAEIGLPAEAGGGYRAEPAARLEEETQVLLTQAIDRNRSLGLGHEVEYVDSFAGDPEHFNVAKAEPAQVDPADGSFVAPGKISISRAGVAKLVEQTPPELLERTLQANIAEEGLHALTTPAEANAYLGTLSALERRMGLRAYRRGATAEEVSLSPELMGHELLRRRMQQLMRLGTSETADLAGLERWSAKSLEFIANIVRRFREFVGTKAAKAGQRITQDMLDRIDANLEAARKAIGAPEPVKGPPVVRTAPPGSMDPNHLVPAIRLIGGEVRAGLKGDTHPDIIAREEIAAEDIDQRGFSDPEGKSFFLDREAAAQATGAATEMDPGRLHAPELEAAQGEAPPVVKPAEPPGEELPFARRREREPKPGMMGQADNGQIFAKNVPDVTDVLHPELGFTGRETWRYDEKSNTAFWNYEPTEEARTALDNFFARQGKPNVKQKTLTEREMNALFGIPARRRVKHEQDMDLARRIPAMRPEEFRDVARSFNRINLDLGINARPEEVAELRTLRTQAEQRYKKALDEFTANPSLENRRELEVAMVMPQFYNEAIRKAEPVPQMPDLEPGKVRLYHGEGAAEGAGLGTTWFTKDWSRAASYGDRVSFVDVPADVATQAQQAARARGSGTSTDHVLTPDWSTQAQQLPERLQPKIYEIPAAVRRRLNWREPTEEERQAPSYVAEQVYHDAADSRGFRGLMEEYRRTVGSPALREYLEDLRNDVQTDPAYQAIIEKWPTKMLSWKYDPVQVVLDFEAGNAIENQHQLYRLIRREHPEFYQFFKEVGQDWYAGALEAPPEKPKREGFIVGKLHELGWDVRESQALLADPDLWWDRRAEVWGQDPDLAYFIEKVLRPAKRPQYMPVYDAEPWEDAIETLPKALRYETLKDIADALKTETDFGTGIMTVFHEELDKGEVVGRDPLITAEHIRRALPAIEQEFLDNDLRTLMGRDEYKGFLDRSMENLREFFGGAEKTPLRQYTEVEEAARGQAFLPFGAAARRRRLRETGPGLPGLPITPTVGARLTRPPTEPAIEAMAKHEAATYQPITPNALSTAGDEYFTGTTAPSLEDYTGSMSRRFGTMKPGQLRQQFEEAFWRWANTATGKQVQETVKDLGLAKRLKIESPTGTLKEIADPPPVTRQLELSPATGVRQVPGVTRPHFVMPRGPLAEPMQGPARPIYGPYDVPFRGRTPSGTRLLSRLAQRVRAQALASIAEKLIVDAEGGRSFLKRKELDPVNDLSSPTIETKEPIYNEFGTPDQVDPDLGRRLTEDARAFGGEKVSRVIGGQVVTVRKKGFPVSASKRLTAIQNLTTKKVSLVSTYRDGRRGPVMVDPVVPGTHSTVDTITRRYRVIASTLLDEPVQDFRKDYRTLSEYEADWGKPARDASQRISEYAPPEPFEEAVPRRTIPSDMVTPEESADIMDQLLGEMGSIKSVDDVKTAWENLKDTTETRRVVSGLRKLGREVLRKQPNLTEGEFLDQLAKQIYENHTKAQTLQEFQRLTMEQSRSPTGEALGVPEPEAPEGAPAVPTGRELTTPRSIAPTAIRGEVLPKGQPPPPHPTIPVEPDMLSPAERAYVEAEATRKHPETPSLYGDMARLYTPITEHEAPASLRRTIRQLGDESRRISTALSAMYKRKEVRREIPAALDAAFNIGNNEGFRAESYVRGATRKPSRGLYYGDREVLAAANSLIAAKAIVPVYNWTPALRAILRNVVNGHPGTPRARKMMATNPAAARAEMARIRQESIQAMIENGDLPAEAPTYSFDPSMLGTLSFFEAQVQQGLQHWTRVSNRGRWQDRARGKAGVKAANDLLAELKYATDHWGDPALVETATRIRRELDKRYDREADAGYKMKYDTAYMPGRYDAEFFNDEGVLFGEPHRVLGKMWRKPKTKRNYYEAIMDPDGPFIAMTRDGASIVGHRARQGERAIQYKAWVESLKSYIDPFSHEPIAKAAKQLKTGGYGGPSPDYNELRYLRPGHEPIALRSGSWAKLIDQLTGRSDIHDWAPSRFALLWGQRLKHTILLGDFFHLARLTYYAASIMGTKMGHRKGLTVLEFREADLPEAVRNGIITQAEANWATERLPIRIGAHVVRMSRLELMGEFEKAGLNIGRIQDAIYKDLVRNVPVLGRYNQWLFDRYTRGMMAQAALTEFERIHKANPTIAPERLLRDISRDLNQYFGSLGRQGVFKSATLQDLSRLVFLAPQWVEGLIDKEIVSAARIAGTPLHAMGLYRNNLNALGTMGRGIGRGLVSMLVLTQLINLIFRKQPTWKNEEEGHKFDAWIPSWEGQGRGFWLSPLAVFNELSHDVIRLLHSKRRAWDAFTQIGSNKLSPWGRLAIVLKEGVTPTKEYITTSGGVLGTAAGQLLPVPISFGKLAQAVVHPLVPSLVPPPGPGAVQRQTLASLGLKVEPTVQPALEITRLAEDFVAKEYGRAETIHIMPTTEPSYPKLRNALRNEDYHGALGILRELEKTKTDQQIIKSMRLSARHPFTGAKKYERDFRASLTPQQEHIYQQAVEQKEKEYQNFLEWFAKQPGR